MAIRSVISAALTWAALFGLYLLLTGQASPDELAAAAAMASVATALSLIIRAGSGFSFRLGPSVWAGPAARALLAVPGDVARVGWRMIRPAAGQLEREPLRTPAATDPSGRAVQVLATSFAPNGYVLGRVQDDRLLVHRLAGRKR